MEKFGKQTGPDLDGGRIKNMCFVYLGRLPVDNRRLIGMGRNDFLVFVFPMSQLPGDRMIQVTQLGRERSEFCSNQMRLV